MSRRELIDRFRRDGPLIAPSLLACDFAHLADEVRALERGGARLLHLDVMDGHFVPNLTYGPVVVESLRKVTDLPLDAHLMIAEPEKYLDDFIEAGCDMVTFHVEAVAEPAALLARLQEADAVAGISLKPATPASVLDTCLDRCDLVLVMSVEPGFGGQEFNPGALEKLQALRAGGDSRLLLEVDGGIKRHNVASAARAGADLLVAGTAVFHAADYACEITELTRLAQSGKGDPL
jgi:ribulose-phosphate 3-epimerase